MYRGLFFLYPRRPRGIPVVLQDLEDFTAENAEIAEKKIVFAETRAFTPTNSSWLQGSLAPLGILEMGKPVVIFLSSQLLLTVGLIFPD